MLNEIQEAVRFLVQLIEKNGKFSPEQLQCFKTNLIRQLMERYKDHWFPDKPFKGQGYRCIRVNSNNRSDSALEGAARIAEMRYEDLDLPAELTVWVDPNEVCCRFGESKGSYCTLASFDDKENTIPVLSHYNENIVQENKLVVDSAEQQKSSSLIISMEQQSKSKPLSSANQNQQYSNNSTGRRRNLNSPRLHPNRNRSWFGHSFNVGYGPHPINQPWYNVMPPHFLGCPSPPPFVGHRGNKWVHPPSYPAGPSRFHHWTPKPTVKV